MAVYVRISFFVFVLGALALATRSSAQPLYRVGDIVQNFTLTNRATGQPVNLTDLEGKIVFLEWFAWWCPFCQAAAAQTGPQIDVYYTARNGNAHGVPVVHVNVNLQSGQESQTQGFINTYGLGTVWNDFSRSAASRFQVGGQPIFAIINGVAGSPSHRQWELVFSHLGYGDLQSPITAFRTAIDSIQAAAVLPPARPAIVQHPLSRTTPAGTSVALSVAATGEGALQYQWKKNNVPIAGATGAQLDLGAVSAAEAGDYSVEVTNPGGGVTSRFARLVVAAPVPGRIVNLSVRAATDGVAPLIVGFVVEGGAKDLVVRGVGPTLGDFGVAGALVDPTLRIFQGATPVLDNDDWEMGDAAGLMSAFARVGAFPLPGSSRDAVLAAQLAGPHTAHIVGKAGTGGVALVEVYDAGETQTPRLVNVSARTQVGSGDAVLVAGFVINGNAPRALLARAVGPGLADFGVAGVIADPLLEIHTTINGADVIVATSDNWEEDANAGGIAAAVPGAFALKPGAKDAALLITLPAGAYTAVARGVGGSVGEGLVEVFEVP